jgi:hypothetical protein
MCHNLSLNSSQNIKFLPKLRAQFSHLAFIFVFFVAKLFSFRHKDTKTLKTNNKIKSFVPARHQLRLRRGGRVFVPWWQIFLGSSINRDFRFATIGLSKLNYIQ